jgi:hypothetical protein
MQDMWNQPFLKVEADALLAAGYKDLGWRELSTEAFGLPNPKRHIILIATAQQSGIVDRCLFSTVWPLFATAALQQNYDRLDDRVYVPSAGSGALWRM